MNSKNTIEANKAISKTTIINNNSGTATVEETIILVTVAVGFGAAIMAVGPMLLEYHNTIEFVLSLPVP